MSSVATAAVSMVAQYQAHSSTHHVCNMTTRLQVTLTLNPALALRAVLNADEVVRTGLAGGADRPLRAAAWLRDDWRRWHRINALAAVRLTELDVRADQSGNGAAHLPCIACEGPYRQRTNTC